MIQSMTGFGKTVVNLPGSKITIEIKTLNSKGFDMQVHLPPKYRGLEMMFRKIASQELLRGKITVSFHVQNIDGTTSTEINPAVVRHYMESLKEVTSTEMHDELELLKIAVNFPEALSSKTEDLTEKEVTSLKTGFKDCLDKVNRYRNDEGNALENDFRLRLDNLSRYLKEIEELDPARIENRRQRLRDALDGIDQKVDESRFEQELVFYLEKYDITEEKTRLNNHLSYFEECLDGEPSNGKKLNFIGQEIGREINTIGSKSNDAPMQKCVVQMKDELEKIKEQVLNVL